MYSEILLFADFFCVYEKTFLVVMICFGVFLCKNRKKLEKRPILVVKLQKSGGFLRVCGVFLV